MTMIGGLDVHRQQITFDYVDDDGIVHFGQIHPATLAVERKILRRCYHTLRELGDTALAASPTALTTSTAA